MARRRYYYRRVVRPKQKWAINNVDVRINSSAEISILGSSNALYYQIVATNGNRVQTGQGEAAISVISSAQILKTGRFKLKACIPAVISLCAVTVFIAYVPEGYILSTGPTSDQNLFYQHPEWIIGWTRKDYLVNTQSNEISITSRLKRNLNTGDNIVVGVMLTNNGSGNVNVTANSSLLHGTLSYCCRAN